MRVAGRFPWSTMGLHTADCHSLRPGGSLCRTGCRVCEQLRALRLYRCQRCGRVVLICRHCDRGHRYYAASCGRLARRESLRRAGQRYQQTKPGKHKHAARMERHRREQKKKVTHQTPLPAGPWIPTSRSGVSPWPEKEAFDVLPQLVPLHPPMRGIPPSSSAHALDSRAAPGPRADPGLGPEHTCHFCGCAPSRLVRRDSLCELRRLLADRAARTAAKSPAPARSPP